MISVWILRIILHMTKLLLKSDQLFSVTQTYDINSYIYYDNPFKDNRSILQNKNQSKSSNME